MTDRPPGAGTIAEALSAAEEELRTAGVATPQEDALRLVEHATGLDHGRIRLRLDRPMDAAELSALDSLVARRAAREPLQHVLGSWPFLELDLAVDARALIPRPETEDVALAARARLAESGGARAADVGTGGGCIALALARAEPRVRVVGLDRSAGALALAAENARRTGLEGRVRFVHGDLAAPLAPAGRLDLIVANLPYVGRDEAPSLEPEVIDHEPDEALFAGDGGLDLIARLAVEVPSRLVPGGWLVLEIAPRQGRAASSLLFAAGLRDVSVARDRFGRERIVSGRRVEG